MSIFRRLKRIIWNKWIKLFWYRLWIRRHLWHVSLDFDEKAMSVMSSEERGEYREDVSKRRTLAHEGWLKRGQDNSGSKK